MGIIGDIKETAKLVQQIGNMDIYRRVLDLQAEAMELLEQLRSKEEETRQLREQLALKKKMVFIKAAYYMKGEDGNPVMAEPFCQKCYDADGIACRLQVDGIYGRCYNCKSTYVLGQRSIPRGPSVV